MKNIFYIKNLLFSVTIGVFITSFALHARPRTENVYGFSLDGYARVKIINRTAVDLACFVAIDGHKIKFKLAALAESKWYKATDKRFKYTDFHTWCDYIELHPEYQQR